MKEPFATRVTFSFGIALPIILGALILSVLYVTVPEWRDVLPYIAVVIAGSGGLYSAFYAGASARLRAHQERLKDSMELVRWVEAPHLLKMRDTLDNKFSHNSVSPSEAYATIMSDEHLRIAARGLLNTFEDIALAVRMGYVDEPIGIHDCRSHNAISWIYRWRTSLLRMEIHLLRG